MSGVSHAPREALPGISAPAHELHFTLVVATLNRVSELDALLMSLERQIYRRFDVVLVDQNDDDRLSPLVDRFRRRFPIRHLRTRPGLSRARNLGIRNARGDVLAFPDDDCVYPADLLGRAAAAFEQAPTADGITVLPRSPDGAAFPRFDRQSGPIRRHNVFHRCSSIGLFIRAASLNTVGGFNEELGLGAGTLWGAGEDVDLPLRAIAAGHSLEYRPDITVVHSIGIGGDGPDVISRAFSYGAGLGWIMRRHRFGFIFSLHYLMLRPLGAMLLNALRGRTTEARFYAASLRGRVRGWLEA